MSESDYQVRIIALENRINVLQAILAALTQRVTAVEQSLSQAWNASQQS
jgi:prefoldin subunit 5